MPPILKLVLVVGLALLSWAVLASVALAVVTLTAGGSCG